jgi:hypothetical protein
MEWQIYEIAEESQQHFDGITTMLSVLKRVKNHSQSVRPSPSSWTEVTSCHDYPTDFISSQWCR